MKKSLIPILLLVFTLMSCANKSNPSNSSEKPTSPEQVQQNVMPTGTIVAFGGTEGIPDGWLLCNGDQYNRTDARYQNLYNVIRTTWGGNGNPFFNVPDLHGLFLRATESRPQVGTGGGAVEEVSSIAKQDSGTDTYEGESGGNPAKRVPGLAHRHIVKTEPPFKYLYYIIKL
jgi:hypothetical protein